MHQIMADWHNWLLQGLTALPLGETLGIIHQLEA
jgi:hypothetical protein